MPFSIIILAAGESVRMKSAVPKVLHTIASVPIIDWILTTTKHLNVKERVVVVGSNTKEVEDHVRAYDAGIKFAVQKNKLGTADAVKVGISQLKNLNNDVLILYGDVPFVNPDTIKRMYSKLNEDSESALVVLGFETEDSAHYGRIVTDKNGNMQKIVEFEDCSEEEKQISLCNSGIMMIKGKHIEKLLSKVKTNNAKCEFYLTDIVGIALGQGLKCQYIMTSENEVTGVNDRRDLAIAEETIQIILRKKFLEEGVTLVDPNTVYFSMGTVIAKDVMIFPNVFIGPGVKIESGVQIKSFSHIEGATIEKNVIIGPFARIRPGTVLNENVRIGNFVEVKNSKIASSSKINHLAYVGDTDMGSNVNIGAGVITCNYDGFDKHKTIIEDDVFVGSNVSFIAPISIGKGALIAASSVITKNVGPYELAIERTEQKNIKNGAKVIAEKNRQRHLKDKPL